MISWLGFHRPRPLMCLSLSVLLAEPTRIWNDLWHSCRWFSLWFPVLRSMREVPTRQAISRYITVMHGMTNLQVFLSSFLRPRLLGFFNLVIHSHATWFLFIVIILLPLWLFRLLSLETFFELFRDYLPRNGQYSDQGREHEVRVLSSTIFPFFPFR